MVFRIEGGYCEVKREYTLFADLDVGRWVSIVAPRLSIGDDDYIGCHRRISYIA